LLALAPTQGSGRGAVKAEERLKAAAVVILVADAMLCVVELLATRWFCCSTEGHLCYSQANWLKQQQLSFLAGTGMMIFESV
jgi:hypothetical protein